jgi:hypothetical protein
LVATLFPFRKLPPLERSVQGDRDYRERRADYFEWIAAPAPVDGTPDTHDISLDAAQFVTSTSRIVGGARTPPTALIPAGRSIPAPCGNDSERG